LTSGATVTVAHNKMISGDKQMTVIYLTSTILLAALFVSCQYLEYNVAQFTITDSVYGSCFYMITGFHGFHVIIGSIFLIVSLNRIIKLELTRHHHLGFESAI
jgi:cytochrome c oxidase subunit 3